MKKNSECETGMDSAGTTGGQNRILLPLPRSLLKEHLGEVSPLPPKVFHEFLYGCKERTHVALESARSKEQSDWEAERKAGTGFPPSLRLLRMRFPTMMA